MRRIIDRVVEIKKLGFDGVSIPKVYERRYKRPPQRVVEQLVSIVFSFNNQATVLEVWLHVMLIPINTAMFGVQWIDFNAVRRLLLVVGA